MLGYSRACLHPFLTGDARDVLWSIFSVNFVDIERNCGGNLGALSYFDTGRCY